MEINELIQDFADIEMGPSAKEVSSASVMDVEIDELVQNIADIEMGPSEAPVPKYSKTTTKKTVIQKGGKTIVKEVKKQYTVY